MHNRFLDKSVQLTLQQLAVGQATIEHHVSRQLSRTGTLVGEVLRHALTTEEKSRLSVTLYSRLGYGLQRKSLWPWEESWFANRLPPAPATVLVTACGGGREVMALEKLGYQVDAFEPAKKALALCRQRVSSRCRLWSIDYGQFSEIALGTIPQPSPAFASRYDAVLLGWGSYSHILKQDERAQLLNACNVICPTGPILVSYLRSSRNEALSTSQRLGCRIGSMIGQWRQLDAERDSVFSSSAGFYVGIDPAELQEICNHLQRQCIVENEPGYSHASLIKAATDLNQAS